MMFYAIGFSMVWSFIFSIKYSEHWNASWMFMLAPLSKRSDLWRGVQATACLYLVAPYTLLMLCIATVLWGTLGIFYILSVLAILLNLIVLYPKPLSGLPLAEEFVQKRIDAAAWIPPVSYVLGAVFAGIQFFAYAINIWIYYGFYFVAVVGGLISFIYLFQKKS